MFRNLSNTFFTRLAIAILNLLVAIIISNLLGADGRGEQGLILTTITFISLFTAIIGSGSITYFTPRLPLRFLLLTSIAWNLLVCLIVLSFANIQRFLSQELFLHVVILGFILTSAHINTSILLGKEKIKQANSIQLFSTLIVFSTISFLFFVVKEAEILVYIKALYFGYGISFVYSLYLLLKHCAKELSVSLNEAPLLESLKQFANYGFLNQLDVVAQMLSFRFSYYIIHFYLNTAEVGVYSNAVSIIESIWLISRSISLVLHARVVNTSDINYSKSLTISLLKFSTIIVFAACLVLYLIPAGFFVFVFGDDFHNVKTVIISFIPGVLVFNASFVFSGFFAGLGKYKYNVIASLAGMVITIGLAIYLVPLIGVVGAGVTASVSYLVTSAVKFLYFKNICKVSISDLLIRKSDYYELLKILKSNK